jgi:carboxymethylenebutenolidase
MQGSEETGSSDAPIAHATSADALSLLPKREISRREFVATTLAAGFALAVMPVTAGTITTDDAGLTVGEVDIPVEGGTIPGYRAMPEGKLELPVILVVQEIFGVHEHIRDLCRRLAKAGYYAIAPELFARQGDVSQITDVQEILKRVVSQVPDAQVMADLDATVEFASGEKMSADNHAITGFCWGGRIVWLYAAHSERLKAGVAWYGRLEGEPTELQPRNPIDVAGEINAPVLGLYGAEDTGIPVESVERMRRTLEKLGKDAEFKIYPKTGHAFNADYRPTYREEAAKDGWELMLKWFRRYGVGE